MTTNKKVQTIVRNAITKPTPKVFDKKNDIFYIKGSRYFIQKFLDRGDEIRGTIFTASSKKEYQISIDDIPDGILIRFWETNENNHHITRSCGRWNKGDRKIIHINL